MRPFTSCSRHWGGLATSGQCAAIDLAGGCKWHRFEDLEGFGDRVARERGDQVRSQQLARERVSFAHGHGSFEV
jgi:hypothetical protein